jgi:hypothetical protein
LASDVFHETADLFLMESGSWLGGGKWIIRRLRLNDSDLALHLCNWAGDPCRNDASLVVLAREVLELSGGYRQEGFLRGKRRLAPLLYAPSARLPMPIAAPRGALEVI